MDPEVTEESGWHSYDCAFCGEANDVLRDQCREAEDGG